MILHRKIGMREYFSCIKSNIFIIVQICLALFLINNQIGYIASELDRIGSIADADNDTYLFQYAMAACGLFDIENGDYSTACKKIRSLPGIEGMGEIFNTSIPMNENSEEHLEDWIHINVLDSIATTAVTYNIKEGRWLNESDRDGNVIHAVLGSALSNKYSIGDKIKIELATNETYEIEVVGKLSDHCDRLDLCGLMASENMYSFMVESKNNIFINHNDIFRSVKAKGLGHATAHCIIKLNKNADKKFLSKYGKLVSFEEMLQKTKEDLHTFAEEASVEGIVWTVVIIFGIIATSYLIGKRRRYVWGIYMMLGEKPNKLLAVHMCNNGITYLLGAAASLLVYGIYYRIEGEPAMSDISIYHIVIDLAFLIIMIIISLLSNLYILKIEPKEILTQTKE